MRATEIDVTGSVIETYAPDRDLGKIDIQAERLTLEDSTVGALNLFGANNPGSVYIEFRVDLDAPYTYPL